MSKRGVSKCERRQPRSPGICPLFVPLWCSFFIRLAFVLGDANPLHINMGPSCAENSTGSHYEVSCRYYEVRYVCFSCSVSG